MALLNKLLVANRGEIAVRILRTANLLGIQTVAVYTDSEEGAGYAAMAGEKFSLGTGGLASTFLNIQKIIDIAIATGTSAIHPGYGFLSENPDFALACREHGIQFVGPDAEVLRLMGNKQEAKQLAHSLGIPVIPGYRIGLQALTEEQELPFPLMIKAAYGGGGKGMKIIGSREELQEQVNRSSRMALEYFGNGELFAEPFIRNARHVEVQLLGDRHGRLVHLGERECSVQRHHQKIIEEAPAAFLAAGLRDEICAAALKIGRAVGYTGAGTVEFLVDDAGNYFFMEMNPRIQVEHAVTEQVTGIDIVAEQLRTASGLPLSFTAEEVRFTGHALEARIYAEDPANDFRPSARPVLSVNLPDSPGIRTEADPEALRAGISHFDPLLVKVIAWGEDRNSAIRLLRNSLNEMNILGPETNTRYLENILAHPDFRENRITTEFCAVHHAELAAPCQPEISPVLLPWLLGFALDSSFTSSGKTAPQDPWDYTGFWRLPSVAIPLDIDGRLHRVTLPGRNRPVMSFIFNGAQTDFESVKSGENCRIVTIGGVSRAIWFHHSGPGEISISCANCRHTITFPGLLKKYPESAARKGTGTMQVSDEITSPMHGKIMEIFISENQLVKKGDALLVIEAMKSENHILSHRDARVKKIAVKPGAQVTDRMPLVYLEGNN